MTMHSVARLDLETDKELLRTALDMQELMDHLPPDIQAGMLANLFAMQLAQTTPPNALKLRREIGAKWIEVFLEAVPACERIIARGAWRDGRRRKGKGLSTDFGTKERGQRL